jgi:molybdenum cofactor cytidylyltransferase
MSEPKIAVAVLSAGESRRMGRAKALLDAGEGETFLGRIVGRAREAGLRRILVVVGPRGGRIRTVAERARATVVENADPAKGPISSIRAAIDVAERESLDAILVWPVDMPLVRADTVARLVRAFRRDGPAIVLPVHGGRRGHPVVHGRPIWPELRSGEADEGARALVRKDPTRVLEVPVDDEGVLLDIDTPREYRRHRFGGEASRGP